MHHLLIKLPLLCLNLSLDVNVDHAAAPHIWTWLFVGLVTSLRPDVAPRSQPNHIVIYRQLVDRLLQGGHRVALAPALRCAGRFLLDHCSLVAFLAREQTAHLCIAGVLQRCLRPEQVTPLVLMGEDATLAPSKQIDALARLLRHLFPHRRRVRVSTSSKLDLFAGKLVSLGRIETSCVVLAIACGGAHGFKSLTEVHVDVWRKESAPRTINNLVSAERAIIVLVNVASVEVQSRVQHLLLLFVCSAVVTLAMRGEST